MRYPACKVQNIFSIKILYLPCFIIFMRYTVFLCYKKLLYNILTMISKSLRAGFFFITNIMLFIIFDIQNILTFLFHLAIFFLSYLLIRAKSLCSGQYTSHLFINIRGENYYESSQKNILQGFSESFSYCYSIFTIPQT